MRISSKLMKSEEKATFKLRELFRQYGYNQFKMGKFEEYDIYVRNKDFIPSGSIITFNDAHGKLMALRPDLTLSIVKNFKPAPGYVEKTYYSEQVYRIAKSDHSYKGILQTGLECIGDIDLYQICEVTVLAAKSLAAISSDYVLELSHMGIVSSILEDLDKDLANELVKCISEKNTSEIKKVCAREEISSEMEKLLLAVVSTYGGYKKVLASLKKLNLPEHSRESLTELEAVCTALADNKLAKNINIDFSIVNHMAYYNGILYRGFINGLADNILAGGQYDRLLTRMGKEGKALGFGLNLDNLDFLDETSKEYDFDVALIYGDGEDISKVLAAAKFLRETGQSVLVQKQEPKAYTAKNIMRIENGEVKILG